METFRTLEKIIQTFPEVIVEPHYEKISFRIKKKIFATYDEKSNRVTVKLTEIDQDDFSSLSPSIHPVDNKWGKQGWTFIDLNEVNHALLTEVLKTAYYGVAPKKLFEQINTIEK